MAHRDCSFSFQWKCPGPESGSEALQTHTSPVFALAGLQWELEVNYNEVKGWMALCFQALTRPAADVNFFLWVTNHSESGKDVCKTAKFPLKRFSYGWDKMISLTDLNRKDSQFCKESQVWVGVGLIPPTAAERGGHLAMPSIRCLSPLYNNADFSDTVIKAKDTNIHVHAAILAAHSASFTAMLKSDMREKRTGEICLKDTDQNVLEACLSFMYGKLKSIPEELLLQIFMFADKYQVVQLRAACAEHMLEDISVDTFFAYIIAADSCCETELLDVCLAYAKLHSYDLAKSPQMKQLMLDRTDLAHTLTVSMLAPKSTPEE